MQLFNIAGNDFTKHITVPSYKVNKHDEYKEWEDENCVIHREIIRTRISGDFTMMFLNKESYYNFINILKRNKDAGGYTPASLYVNNTDEVVDTKVFISIDPENAIPLIGNESHKGFEVQITER